MQFSFLHDLFGGVPTAFADTSAAKHLVGRISVVILNPLIIAAFAGALVYFLYGVVMFLANADKAEEREKGKSHMLWGIVGIFIMIAVFAIVKIIEGTFGLDHNTGFGN